MATIETRIYEGDRAKEILENPIFVAVFADIEQELMNEWKQSPARDQEGREKLWQYLRMLDKIKSRLTTTLETGTLAKLELQHRQLIQYQPGTN